jgi:hypothetical protein
MEYLLEDCHEGTPFDCIGWAIDHLRNLLARVPETIEMLEHRALA